MFVSPPSLITRVCVLWSWAARWSLFPLWFSHSLKYTYCYYELQYSPLSSVYPQNPHPPSTIHHPHPQLLSPLPSSSQASPTQVPQSRSLGSKASQSDKEPLHCFHIRPLPSSGNTRYLPLVDASATVLRTIAQPETQVSVASERSRLW